MNKRALAQDAEAARLKQFPNSAKIKEDLTRLDFCELHERLMMKNFVTNMSLTVSRKYLQVFRDFTLLGFSVLFFFVELN